MASNNGNGKEQKNKDWLESLVGEHRSVLAKEYIQEALMALIVTSTYVLGVVLPFDLFDQMFPGWLVNEQMNGLVHLFHQIGFFAIQALLSFKFYYFLFKWVFK